MTGLGDALGVTLGACILVQVEHFSHPSSYRDWSEHGPSMVAVSLGCLLSGGIWQAIVDLCIEFQVDFISAMLIITVACTFMFWTGLTLGKKILTLDRKGDFIIDGTLAIACGGGNGFFVGTDSRFSGNFLAVIVGERNGYFVEDSVLAGCSTCLGFLCVQVA